MGYQHEMLDGQYLSIGAAGLGVDSVESSELDDNSVDIGAIEDGVITGAKFTTPANTRSVTMYLPEIAAGETQYIFVAPSACTVTEVNLVVEVTLPADSGANYYSVQIRNLTQSEDLLASAKTNSSSGGTAITADTAWVLTPDQNETIADGDVIELQFSETGSEDTISRAIVTVEYTVAT